MERAGALGPDRRVLARDAERTSASAAAASGASRLTARKQPVSALDMQPVPVIAAMQRMAVLDADHGLAVGDVIDRAGDRSDDAELPRDLARELGGIGAGGDRLDTAHLGFDPDERRDLAGVAAGTVTRTSAKIRFAVSVR